MDVNRALLVLTIKNHFPIYFTKIEVFLNFANKSPVKTGPNCSYKLATFLKYQMPLRSYANQVTYQKLYVNPTM